jgi:hypothetical protein
VQTTTPSPARASTTAPSTNRAHLDQHLLCAHLHDRHHIHHLCGAVMICTINVIMTLAVPSLAIQLLVTVAFFGRDALTILMD